MWQYLGIKEVCLLILIQQPKEGTSEEEWDKCYIEETAKYIAIAKRNKATRLLKEQQSK